MTPVRAVCQSTVCCLFWTEKERCASVIQHVWVFPFFLLRGETSQTHKIWPFSTNLKCGFSLNKHIYFTFVCPLQNTHTHGLKYYTLLSISGPYIWKIIWGGQDVKPFRHCGSSAVLKRLIKSSRMQIRALLFTQTWRPVTHWKHCESMQ